MMILMPSPRSALALALTVALATSSLLVPQAAVAAEAKGSEPWHAAPMDWPHWRGPEMNGISREKKLEISIDPEGETLLWKNEELGGRSSPIVMNGKLYTIVRDKPHSLEEGEKVVAVDPETGKILWENRFNAFLTDVPDTRVGWSSVIGDPSTGNVFALGVCGLFQCINGETGETIWSHSLSEEYGLLSTYGGRTNFPVVHGNLAIISAVIIGWGDMAKPAHRFIAFDKRNGQPVWFEGTALLPTDTTYSAPILTVFDGQAAMVFGSGDGGIHAFQPRTGKKIWSYEASARGINTTPVIADGLVVAGHSEENVDDTTMGALFALHGTKSGDLAKVENGVAWRHKEMGVGKAAPIVVDGRVYAVEDGGTLRVIDLKTGEQIGKTKIGTMGRASPVYADGKIYVFEANGRGYVYEPADNGVKAVERVRFNNEEFNGSPAISHGRLFVPGTGALYCFGKSGAEPEADPRPEPPVEAPVSEDDKPAQVQVVPVEALLAPGQKQQYSVRLYNAKGQYLRDANDAELTLEGLGSLENGKYSSSEDAGHGAAFITAKVGDLTGTARVRVIPDFPWSFDFEDGVIPISWVGIRYRHVPLDFDLLKSLRSKHPLAGPLYIYTTTSFVNSAQPKAMYKDVGPRLGWTELRRYLGLLNSVGTLEQAREQIDPALQALVDEKILSKYTWSNDGGVSLAVERGAREVEGNGVMCKITTIPLGTRSQGWMGRTDFSDYTIQADVMANSVATADAADPQSKMPDIGVIGQRYRFELMGASQELKLYSWVSHERKFHTVPFEWKPGIWYTMKLTATTEKKDGEEVSVLRGKAWPRDSEEPKDWQIEWTDKPANTIGAPGLTGNAKDSEIFIDNIKVMKN